MDQTEQVSVNTVDIPTLITAITAFIVAVTGFISLIVHIIIHQQIPGGNPADPPGKPSLITPVKRDKPA